MSATTYEQALAKLDKPNAAKAVVIGNNTTVERNTLNDEDILLVRLHGHGIVLLHANGDVSVRDCGYVTNLTYQRLHQFVPPGWVANIKQGQGRVYRRPMAEGRPTVLTVKGQEWTRIEG